MWNTDMFGTGTSGMMDGTWHWFMGFQGLVFILFLVIAVVAVVLLLRDRDAGGPRNRNHTSDACDIDYAEGKIGREEYLRRRNTRI